MFSELGRVMERCSWCKEMMHVPEATGTNLSELDPTPDPVQPKLDDFGNEIIDDKDNPLLDEDNTFRDKNRELRDLNKLPSDELDEFGNDKRLLDPKYNPLIPE
jgi:hypothetical protein